MQLLDCPLNYLELMDEEVCGVAFVRLGLQEGSFVLRRRFSEDLRDRQVLDEPVALLAHRPEEEDPRGASVPVLERMIGGEAEVEEKGRDHGMYKLFAVLVLVGDLV